MKRATKLISFLLAFAMGITSFNLPIFAQEQAEEETMMQESEPIQVNDETAIESVFVENSFLSREETQKIAVTLKNPEIVSASLIVCNERDDTETELEGIREGTAFVFEKAWDQSGIYVVKNIKYILNDQTYILDFSDMDMDIRFGVEEEATDSMESVGSDFLWDTNVSQSLNELLENKKTYIETDESSAMEALRSMIQEKRGSQIVAKEEAEQTLRFKEYQPQEGASLYVPKATFAQIQSNEIQDIVEKVKVEEETKELNVKYKGPASPAIRIHRVSENEIEIECLFKEGIESVQIYEYKEEKEANTETDAKMDAFALKNKDALQDGEYVLYSKSNKHCVMDVEKENVQLNSDARSVTQQWEISHDAKGYVTFKNKKTGDVLSVEGKKAKSSVNVHLEKQNEGMNQKWVAVQDGPFYKIVSALDPDYVLDLHWGEVKDGSNIQIYESNDSNAQRWGIKTIQEDQVDVDQIAKENQSSLKDGIYTIHLKRNKKYVLDVKYGSVSSGANVQLYEGNGTKAQQWKISHDAKGYVEIRNVGSHHALHVEEAIAKNEGNVCQRTVESTKAQKWIAIPDGDSYKIVSALDPDYVLDLHWGEVQNSSNIQLYESNDTDSQRWIFEMDTKNQVNREEIDQFAKKNEKALKDGVYTVELKKDKKYVLDIERGSTKDGANIQLYKGNGTKAQQWKVSHDAKGYVEIRNVGSNHLLSVAGAQAENEGNVQQNVVKNTNGQKWIAIPDGDSYKLTSALNPNYVLDLHWGEVKNGSNIQLYESNDSSAQRWCFVKKSNYKGWKKKKGSLYYYNQNGELVKGTFRIGKVTYTTNSSGKVLTSKVSDVPYFSQKDPRWSNQVVGYYYFGGTGCCPTTIAMYIDYLTGLHKTPIEFGKELYINGYFNCAGIGTDANAWKYIAKKYDRKITTGLTLEELKLALLQGKVFGISVGPGKFCPWGYTHAMLIHSMDEHGRVYVQDPLHQSNNGWYSLESLFNQRSQDPLDWIDKNNSLTAFITLE